MTRGEHFDRDVVERTFLRRTAFMRDTGTRSTRASGANRSPTCCARTCPEGRSLSRARGRG
ncbi:hypothetical protein E1295_33755 [Nonomuraea mesophila]|uniref:Uncharacterized protein n=1 Tax=Nonomuraea mesophila TaxID=2530382 RepID=A0A4R5ETW9_9ACTN|nr:hypothetical protein E1295_33755 [Nonomuraea mesophila]